MFLSLATRKIGTIAEALSLDALIEARDKVFVALEQVLDAAEETRRGPQAASLADASASTADPSAVRSIGGSRVEELGDEATAPEPASDREEKRHPPARQVHAEEQNVMMVIVQLARAMKRETARTDSEYLKGRIQLIEGLKVLASRMGLQI